MLTLTNPATEEVLATVEEDTPESIASKYEAARLAQIKWADQQYFERSNIVQKFRQLLEDNVDDLAKTLSQEMGKPVQQAKNEILGVQARIDFFLDQTATIMATETVFREESETNVSLAETASSDTDPEMQAVSEEEESVDTNPELAAAPDTISPEGGYEPPTTQTDLQVPAELLVPPITHEERISYEPLGVVANISAWNYPYFVGANVFIPAILTGSSVLYKPSEFTTQTGQSIAKLWEEAGLPEGVFTTIVGGGAVGSALLEQPVDAVFFTGSYPTGKKIAAAAAQHLIPVQLELGGKDPIYVRADVPVKDAATAVADGAFYNAGQSCCAVERIYVHSDIYDEFVENFVETVKGFVVGDPLEEDTYIGPLARKEQIGVLEAQLADAKAKGAEVLVGGSAKEGTGYYFQPTVITNVDHSMDVMKEESFGPIIGIMKVDNDDEAIEKMNDTTFGLTAGIYTKDQDAALGLLKRVNAGSAYWNCCDRISPMLPWSGRGHSGLGSTLSHLGIRAFLKPKAWHLKNPFLDS